MNRSVIILATTLLLSTLPSSLFAQTVDSLEKVTANSLGADYFKKANAVFKKSYDQANIYLDSALFHYQSINNWEGVITCMVGKATIFNKRGDYIQYDSILNLALQLGGHNLQRSNSAYVAVLNSYAFYKRNLGNYEEALALFREVLAADKASGHKIFIASTQTNLGTTYTLKGDYKEALKLHLEARQNQFETKGKERRYGLSSVFIGNAYRNLNQPSEATKYYEEAVKILTQEKLKLKNNNAESIVEPLTQALLSLAELALEKKDWNEVKKKVAKAKEVCQGIYVADQGRGFDILGALYIQQGNHQKAIENFSQSLNIAREEFSTYKKHSIVAEKELKLASVYLSIKDFDLALDHYHKALKLVAHGFHSTDVFANPTSDSLYSKIIALDALKGKGKCFYNLYKKNSQHKNLDAAYQQYLLALEIIPNLRQSFKQEGSKELLSTKVLPFFEEAIELAIIFHQKTGDIQYLKDAFSYAEGNKSILLLESINEISAKDFANIPDSLLAKEKQLSSEITLYQKLINEEKQISNNQGSSSLEKLNRKLFQLDEKHQSLIETFEKDFPKYYELKYKTTLVNVDDLQKIIPDQSKALIEYFIGNKYVFVFTITSEDIAVHQFEKDASFEDDITTIRKIISQPPAPQNINLGYQRYTTIAHDLFTKLIAPSLNKNINSLIIIPDDILGLLPFGVLLTEPPSDTIPSYHLENLEYLIEQVDISYSYSSTLLLNKHGENKPIGKYPFVGFAPSFKELEKTNSSIRTSTCDMDNLYSLKNSQEEVTEIQSIWGGKLFLGQEANLSTFETYAPQSDIIHLATHACIDDNNHQFNTIFFTDGGLSNNHLIKKVALNSRLAVLSACNTGTGQLVKGEGVMSLSRGFIHAGCPSVVMSLWSVNDKTTADLMKGFYKCLNKNKSKDYSLRKAKLDFIKDSEKKHQHPFYWATFVQFGDARPMGNSSFFSTKNLILFGVSFLGLFILFQFFQNRK